MRIQVAALIGLLGVFPAFAQKTKKEQKPAVHADFQFGMYPESREIEKSMLNEQTRLLLVASAVGWDIDKIAKTFKLSSNDLIKLSDNLEDDRWLRRDEYNELHAGLPVIRERDFDRLSDGMLKHSQEFGKLIQGLWPEIETAIMGLEGSKSVPKERVLYEAVVSGILFGGKMDAFYEDKTMMPPPPRRGKNANADRYYGWLVESNPTAAGKIKRELRESDNYRIISIGSELPEERLDADDIRGKGTVYEDQDAVKYRRFIGVFTRDKLLPYFKSHRAEFLAQSAKTSLGYVAFAEFFAWYYNWVANQVVDDLVATHRIAAPDKYYIYAVRAPM